MTEAKPQQETTGESNPFLDDVSKLTGGTKYSFVTVYPKCCSCKNYTVNVYAGENANWSLTSSAQPDTRAPLLTAELKTPCCDDPILPLANASKQLVFQPKWPGAFKCCEPIQIQNGSGATIAQVKGPSCGQKITGKACPCLGKITFRACDASGADRFTLRKFGCCKNPYNDKCCDFEADVECEGCDECCEFFGELTDCIPGMDQIPGLSACLAICKTIKCKECNELRKCNKSSACDCLNFYRVVPVFSGDQKNVVPIAKIEFKGFWNLCKNSLRQGYQVIITPPTNCTFNDAAALLLMAMELDRATVQPMLARNGNNSS